MVKLLYNEACCSSKEVIECLPMLRKDTATVGLLSKDKNIE